MPVNPMETFADGDYDYVENLNANFGTLEAFVNSLEALVLSVGPEGQALVTDLWDRPGLVGSHSYVIDLENYAGGATISIGRRPTAETDLGDQDLSVAFLDVAGTKQRAEMSGDTVLNASGFITGLPKTLYVVIPSNGTPQFLEAEGNPLVLYAYSCTWDGYQLTDWKRLAPILAAYPTLQAIVGAPRVLQVQDMTTDFNGQSRGDSSIFTLGKASLNEIEVNGTVEILGFFVHALKAGEDGFKAADVADPERQKLVLNVECDGEVWNDEAMEFDCSAAPDSVFVKVATGIGSARYVTEPLEFKLVRESIGDAVISAAQILWGVIYRPVIGVELPCDTDYVKLV